MLQNMRIIIITALLFTSCQKCYDCTETTHNQMTGESSDYNWELCATQKQLTNRYEEARENNVPGVYSTQLVCTPID